MKSEAHSITRERKHNNNDILKIDPSFDIPPWLGVETIARFVYENMKPYEDALEDTRRGL